MNSFVEEETSAQVRVAGVEVSVRDKGPDQIESLRPMIHPATVKDGSHGVLVAQRAWATLSVRERMAVLRRGRFALAEMSEALAAAMPEGLARMPADTLVAEILPLLAACKFLEQSAEEILKVRRLGLRGLPFWLAGTDGEVRRVPFGTVLVIGPSNYPLFLPGVQTLQALAAGNAVVWKPGRGGKRVAELFTEALRCAGLPEHLLRVTEDSIAAGGEALQGRVDKVVFTGSAENGRAVLRAAAERLIPCVIEASGSDAVIVLPSADRNRVVKALAFGMRLNGSATCMAPRRVLIVGGSAEDLVEHLVRALESVPAVTLGPMVWEQVMRMLADAESRGGTVVGELVGDEMRPIVVSHATSEMEIAQADVFAPVLSVIEVDDVMAAQEACPFGLTAAVFGNEREARALADKLEVGTVLINDLIVSTADPRVSFGGRRLSGFGVTRGAEGLLEMTAAKVVSVKRGKGTRQYEPTSATHAELFDGVIATAYGKGFKTRWQGLRKFISAGRKLGSGNESAK